MMFLWSIYQIIETDIVAGVVWLIKIKFCKISGLLIIYKTTVYM